MSKNTKLAEILLVEDNEGDIELTKEAFESARFRNNLSVATDGEKALDFLYKRNGFEASPTPDLILLDLNLPKIDGHEVLTVIKNEPKLQMIPTVVLTSSNAGTDITASYSKHANCYIVKPIDAQKFISVIQNIENFWIDVVCLPPTLSKN